MSSIEREVASTRPKARARPVALWARFSIAMALRDTRRAKFYRRRVWDPFYGVAAREVLPLGLFAFLNLGYVADPDKLDVEDGPEIADRLSESLYDQVVADTDLEGRAVVEVGCGSGAGSAYLARTRFPASWLGIDRSKDMIAWCEEHHNATNLRFAQGDAQQLPLASSSVDAVVNLESSHCYPSRSKFFKETARVLRPGGSFLLADLIFASGESEDDVSAYLREAELIIDDCIDITENVLAARNAVSSSPFFQALLQERVPRRKQAEIEEHMFIAGSQPYKRLVSGQTRYVQWRASKPNE
jgi:ubiquinone/menaquinone biosynthesis C-methylase UbiE